MAWGRHENREPNEEDGVWIKLTIWNDEKKCWEERCDLVRKDTVPKLISKLKDVIEKEKKTSRKSSEKTKPEPDTAPSLNDLNIQLNNYQKSGKEVLGLLKECTHTCLDSQRYIQRSNASEDYLKRAMKYYESLKQDERIYDTEVCDYIRIFNEIKGDFACFAGCISEELYDSLSASILNKKRHMSLYIQKNADLLNKMGDITALPRYKEPMLYKDAQDNAECKGLKKYDDAIGQIKMLLDKSENVSHLSVPDLYAVCEEWSRYEQMMQDMQTELTKQNENYCIIMEGYKSKNSKYYKDAQRYLAESQKKAAAIRSHEKEWEYYRLLRLAYPLMKKICSLEDETDPAAAVPLFRQTWELLDCFNGENRNYKFRWITHSDEVCMKSEDIRVDFMAGEANWPGLYIYPAENPEELICVAPGSVSDV